MSLSEKPLRHFPFAKVLKSDIQKIEEMLGIDLVWKKEKQQGTRYPNYYIYTATRGTKLFTIAQEFEYQFYWKIECNRKDEGAIAYRAHACKEPYFSYEEALFDLLRIIREEGY